MALDGWANSCESIERCRGLLTTSPTGYPNSRPNDVQRTACWTHNRTLLDLSAVKHRVMVLVSNFFIIYSLSRFGLTPLP